jgi:arginine decarboxylase
MIGEDTVDRAVTLTESTSPNSLLCGSLDAARRQAAVHGRELLEHTMAELARTREQIRAIDGLDVLDERLAGRPGVFAYDPLRLAVDVRGVAASGYELAPLLREIDDINLELYGQNVLVAVFGMGERGLGRPRGWWRRCARPSSASGLEPGGAARASRRRRPGGSSR